MAYQVLHHANDGIEAEYWWVANDSVELATYTTEEEAIEVCNRLIDRDLTPDEIAHIEQTHNVYIDRDSILFNAGGGYKAITGWMPIPEAWIEEVVL